MFDFAVLDQLEDGLSRLEISPKPIKVSVEAPDHARGAATPAPIRQCPFHHAQA